MSWRIVVVDKRAKLSLQQGFLILHQDNDRLHVPVNEIGVLIIENTACAVTVGLLEALWKYKVNVIFCDSSRNPAAQMLPLHGAHNSGERILKQVQWGDGIKNAVWAEIVREKIRKQAAMIRKYEPEASKKVFEYSNEVLDGDPTNREGQAAKVYLNALFWKGYDRRDKEFIFNKYLNYGYAVLLACVNRSIACMGYMTQIGIFHKGPLNPFNLGCDLMEPLRPLIDRTAVSLPIEDELLTGEKDKLINTLNQDCYIEGRKTTVLAAINTYVKSVLDALNEEDISLIKFCDYEF